jgi:hypothetical protein
MDPLGLMLVLVGGYALSRMSAPVSPVAPVPTPDALAQPVAAPAPGDTAGTSAKTPKEAGVSSLVSTGKEAAPGPKNSKGSSAPAQSIPLRQPRMDPGVRASKPLPRPTKTV